MCYSSCEGWRSYKKDATREKDASREETELRPEAVPEEAPEPQVQAEESKLWAYLAQLEESTTQEPDPVRENV
ncbi:MAG: hypothetical protein JWN19_325 [Arthrobacter sp.]|jgi:hypothetical protein|nr:hypothetical protein [Arthrobacter sp.]